MKAVIHDQFGAPRDVLTLQEIAVPTAGQGEVLVKVRAVAVAKGDWLIAQGLPYIARPSYGLRTPKQRVSGLELAGVVEAVGGGVTGIGAGDEVFGWTHGALAEHVTVPADQLAVKPRGISFEQAAALPMSGLAALQAVRDAAAVGAGTSVLIIGASGGVGSFAVQIAKALGGEVTGVASTRNLELVRQLGADHVIDYTTTGITDRGRRFDVIVDIAGNRSLSELRRALTPRGTLVIVGGSGGRVTMGFGRSIRAMLLSPFVSQRLSVLISQPNHDDLLALANFVANGDVAPKVDATYPLAEAAAAIELVGAGRSRAKTVVTV